MDNLLGVRFIPTDHHPKRGWAGNKPALCFRGTKYAHCVIIGEAAIETVDLPIDVVEKSNYVVDPMGQAVGMAYPPERFIHRIKEIGKPISDSARKLLQTVNGKKVALPKDPPKKVLPTRLQKPGQLKTAGADLIIQLAAEVKLPTPKLRRFLRSQGLRAPYTDESVVRKALAKLKKGKVK